MEPTDSNPPNDREKKSSLPKNVTSISEGGEADTPRIMAENVPWESYSSALVLGLVETEIPDQDSKYGTRDGFYPSLWISKTDIKTLCFLRDWLNLYIDDLLR